MKNLYLFTLLFLISFSVSAQVEKEVNCTPGELHNLVSSEELDSISKLVLSGSIDKRDFDFLRDSMLALTDLDMGKASIQAYGDKCKADEIPDSAFWKDEIIVRLNSMVLPNNLVSIGEYAFCRQPIVSVLFPSSGTLQSIEECAFVSCSLAQVTLYEGLVEIKKRAFSSASIKELVLPQGLESIGEEAFRSTPIKTLLLPKGLKFIGKYAFAATWLESVTFQEAPLVMEKSVFSGSELTSVELPKGMKEVPEHTFNNCNKLTSIFIPEGMTRIKRMAFRGCPLKKIWMNVEKPFYMVSVEDVFNKDLYMTVTLYVPLGSAPYYNTHSFWWRFIIRETNLMPPLAIGDTRSESLNICAHAQGVSISSELPVTVRIHTLTGGQVCTRQVVGQEQILLPEGYYLVQAGEECVKVRVGE